MVISSRTPEGRPNLCPICGTAIKIEPSDPAGEAPCPNCGHLLWFTGKETANTIIIKPTSAILRSEDLDALADDVEGTRGVQVVLDLSDVQYITSQALGRLMHLRKRIVRTKGKLRIENLQGDLLEIFRITRLDQVLEIGR